MWVWDVETDQLQTYDFGTSGRVPVSAFWDSAEPKVGLMQEGVEFLYRCAASRLIESPPPPALQL